MKLERLLGTAIFILSLSNTVYVNEGVRLTFDDMGLNGSPAKQITGSVSPNYDGLYFFNLNIVQNLYVPQNSPSILIGIASGKYAIISNGDIHPALIDSTNRPSVMSQTPFNKFDFSEAYFTAVNNNVLLIKVEGHENQKLIMTKTFTINHQRSRWIKLDMTSVTKLLVYTRSQNKIETDNRFVIDNFTY